MKKSNYYLPYDTCGQDLERLDIFGDSIFHFLGVIVLLVSYSHPL